MAVLTTDEAEQLARSLAGNIQALRQAFDTMLATGDRLASPGVWEGQAANHFQQEWQETRRWAATSVERLTELQDDVARVNQNISEAGGGR